VSTDQEMDWFKQQLVELQSQLAFQEDTIQALNDVVARQQQQLEQLNEFCHNQKSQLEEIASEMGGGADNDKPPHY
jgi:SlyX protein